ncbi:RICIN domain-containing protein [Streptomyces sp. NPDC051940]|uniref:RICIN domain-containing protein n=1 Tax=Streptomyces sp. NPDC051940 TaxID=3155675 RepID=UPI00342D0A72
MSDSPWPEDAGAVRPEDATEILPRMAPGPPPPSAPPPAPRETTAVLPPMDFGPPTPPRARSGPPKRTLIAAAAIAVCAAAGLGIGALASDGEDTAPPARADKATKPATASPSPEASASTPPPSPTGPPPVLGGPYLMVSADTGLAADVAGVSVADGAPVIAFQRLGAPNQQWTLADAGAGLVQIKAVHSGMCLQSDGAVPNAPVVQQTCAQADTQRWRLTPDGGGFALSPSGSAQTLGIGPADAQGLTPLQLQQPGAAGQRWTLSTP